MALSSTHIFVNLHVKDVKKSIAFFTELGFEFNMQFTDEEKAACLVIGDNMFAMLLTEDYFKSFTKKEVVDTGKYAELTIALSAESREKVDEIVNKAISVGGQLYCEPADHGFMYQWGFQDPDGHIWEIAHMDMNSFEGQDEV
ncbi:glyoxalase/bleomycin resistance/extradiol dioxygenase family protein [Paenibacillus donghaensis]|uniref:VOC family protein n=1 Tax=Paenibacillus donghaensis TaxID=414771 RepID=UPI001884100B|nr:VOC family protein [Paenibacillus donghaensis]MBE9914097.1 glyoxalase/bleomycin resistance/extradiol dioxygenase family protein [Paenibacillus donghaensis]